MAQSTSPLSRLQTFGSFVRVGHAVFALPFALVGGLLAMHEVGFQGWRLAWIVLCMVTARSAAMGFNRVVDARFDARNPRTAARELPAGRMTTREAWVFVIVSSLLFVASTVPLGWLCVALSPVALAIVFWYSLAKRVTSYTQAFLGLAMAVAPIGAWLGAGGGVSVVPALLGLAIGAWVAGFDILYACQDVDVDRREGLHSIPVRFGVRRAIAFSRTLHVGAVAALAAVGFAASLGPLYQGGVVLVAGLLAWEQSMIAADDLSQVKRAFDLNGWVGLLYLAVTAVAVYWR
jgi:4-hydroxybenzoate polyprenyltransferase